MKALKKSSFTCFLSGLNLRSCANRLYCACTVDNDTLLLYNNYEVEIMSIKEKLIDYGYNLSELAGNISISRRTLYNYIDKIELKQDIANNEYDVFFKKIYNNINDISEINSIIKHFIERMKVFEQIDIKKEMILQRNIIDLMRKDLHTKDYDPAIYLFIKTLIESYKKEVQFSDFAQYVLSLNSFIEIDVNNLPTRQKAFYSNVYKIMNLSKKKKLEVDNEYLSKFIERYDKIKSSSELNRQKYIEENRELIETLLKEKLLKKSIEGVKLKNISINDLIDSNLDI